MDIIQILPTSRLMYVAKNHEGKVACAAWDDSGYEASNSSSVMNWLNRGYIVSKIKIESGSPELDWI